MRKHTSIKTNDPSTISAQEACFDFARIIFIFATRPKSEARNRVRIIISLRTNNHANYHGPRVMHSLKKARNEGNAPRAPRPIMQATVESAPPQRILFMHRLLRYTAPPHRTMHPSRSAWDQCRGWIPSDSRETPRPPLGAGGRTRPKQSTAHQPPTGFGSRQSERREP